MSNKIKYTIASTIIFLFGCAAPQVVSVKQVGDSSLGCSQLKAAHDEAQQFEENARKDRKVTGTNVAAAVFFWPALLATYSNTGDAIDAAKDRQRLLVKIADEKQCKW